MRRPLVRIVVSLCIGAAFMCTSGVLYAAPATVKQPNVAGAFYPAKAADLAKQIDGFLETAKTTAVEGKIFALIAPHAGYDYSGSTAGHAYKLIKGASYKTVVILAPVHYSGIEGATVWPEGAFRTPLGDVPVDAAFGKALLAIEPGFAFQPRAFDREHTLEVQLPFLQRTLKDFSIVPVMVGDCSFRKCQEIAAALKKVIAGRNDVLVVASSDMYHGYDYREAELIDRLTLSCIQAMDAEGLYQGLAQKRMQLCGGFGVVATMLLAKEMGHTRAIVEAYTNSAEVTGVKRAGEWTVGYGSLVIIDGPQKNEVGMLLDKGQKKRLLEIARSTIEQYLKTRKAPDIKENDPVLAKEMGAFVTLHQSGELRGCIGNMVGRGPLYATVRDMAVEAGTGDPRFAPVRVRDLANISIEISVLSPLRRVASADEIVLGTHGVLVRKGFNSG
ncbi:MAG: AmmeMemoRadiSam system protein B, partial [Candidatus Omnitrophica bacterium]|nr:AmmeMemoRadiSam system protein B [Candidatus Omnitrophota bacterium]